MRIRVITILATCVGITFFLNARGVAVSNDVYDIAGVASFKDNAGTITFPVEWTLRTDSGAGTALLTITDYVDTPGSWKTKSDTHFSASFRSGWKATLEQHDPGSKPKVKRFKMPHLYRFQLNIAGSIDAKYSQKLAGVKHKFRMLGDFAGALQP